MMLNTRKSYSLSVFFPFYNEEDNIRLIVEEALKTLENIKEVSEYEIIMVDDGSRDKTRRIAEDLTKEYANVKLVAHGKNLGYGNALISGIRGASCEYVFFTDGDSQFDIKEIKKLLEHIPEYQMVIGYRAPRRDSLMRILNAKGWNLLNRVVFGLKVKDINCAFKLFKKELVADLPIMSGGAMLSAELLIRLQRKGIALKEVAVSHFPRQKGSATGAKLSIIARAFREFWRFCKDTNFGKDL